MQSVRSHGGGRPSSSELKPATASGLCDSLHSSLIGLAGTVKHNHGDALLQALLCNFCSYDFSCVNRPGLLLSGIAALLGADLLQGAGLFGSHLDQRYTSTNRVVDDAGMHVHLGSKDSQSGPCSIALDLPTNVDAPSVAVDPANALRPGVRGAVPARATFDAISETWMIPVCWLVGFPSSPFCRTCNSGHHHRQGQHRTQAQEAEATSVARVLECLFSKLLDWPWHCRPAGNRPHG
mmetsp:Transcript_38494/g.53788  ORF Transcript_38494/g.53788 Transcript_38494/m.53788 type:complete len:237 (+) Transcript_38494:75-785(+)